MGVYIKGMEMPHSCNECRFSVNGFCRASPKLAVGAAMSNRERTNFCPLVYVPAHGRLIDADATDIYRREERAYVDIENSPFSEYLEGVKDGLHEAAKCLSTARTIIPADPPEGGET